MADTERSTAVLLSTFADNQAGAISAQDARDLIVTVLGGYASIYTVDAAAAQATAAAAAKLTAFAADGPALGSTPAHASDQITIGTTGVYWVEFGADLEADTAGTYTAALYNNGSAEGTLKSVCEFEASTETRSWHFAAPLSLTAADVLTVYVSGPTANITVKQGRLAVKRIG